MTNIYVSPLTAPSFECLAVEAQRPPAEFSAMNGEDKAKGQLLDENANETLSVATTETETALQHPGANSCKEQVGESGHKRKRTNSPNVVGTIITGTVTITTISFGFTETTVNVFVVETSNVSAGSMLFIIMLVRIERSH